MDTPFYQKWEWNKARWRYILVCSNCGIEHKQRWMVCPKCGALLDPACRTPHPVAAPKLRITPLPDQPSETPTRKRERPRKVKA